MVDDVGVWLEKLGLRRYAEAFAEQEITLTALWQLTEADLKEIGLPVGPRRIISSAIAKHLAADENLATGLQSGTQSTPHAEPERRQLTVMFCDMVGSTAMSQVLDPEDLREVMRRYHEAVAGAITRYGGYLARHLGDGVLAYFGWPQADENQAVSALWTGLDAIRAVEAIKIDDSISLRARVGIATGLVVVGDLVGKLVRDPGTVIGETPNLAARLQGLAEPGEVVIDTSTYSLVGEIFRFESRGNHELKGFEAPVPVWKVTGQGVIRSRFEAVHPDDLTPFVGREHELGLLKQRWHQAKRGKGQVVLLSGEAGIGKSRLVHAFGDVVGAEPHFRLSYQCSPHHQNSAFYPAIQHIKRNAGFVPNENINIRLNKLETLLRSFSEEEMDNFQLFASLLSLPYEHRYGKLNLSPQKIREQTIETLIAQLFALESKQPVFLLVEDAHWIDPTTERLIGDVMQLISDAKILILVTCRPSYTAPWNDAEIEAKIHLNRLPQDQGEAIVKAIGGSSLPISTMREILNRADGIPFFVEELTKSLLESDNFEEIPKSLQALLVARLDRLGSNKKIAQLASVLGKSFSYSFIQAVGEFEEDELAKALSSMLEAGLLIKTGLSPHIKYRFKHALIQDAAYQTLLLSRRKEQHQRVAEILLKKNEDSEDREPELIAWHLSQGGLPEKATKFWLLAGQRAGQRFAHFEAIKNLENGLNDVSKLPKSRSKDEQEFDIRTALSASLLTVKGWSSPEVASNYKLAQDLSASIGDDRKHFIALRGRANVFFLNGSVGEARVLVDQLTVIAKELDDPALLLDAYRSTGMCELFAGEFKAAREQLHKANKIYDKSEHHALAYIYGTDPAVIGYLGMAWANWFLGNPQQAHQFGEAALDLAKELQHPFSLAYAHCLTSSTYQFCQQPNPAKKHAELAISIAEEHGFTYWLGWAKVVYGWAQAALDDLESGINNLNDGLEIYQSTGASQITPYILTLLAEMYGWAGKAPKGLEIIEDIIGPNNKSDVLFYHAEALHIAGRLTEQTNPGEVDNYLAEALDLARSQGAQMLELRILTSLVKKSGKSVVSNSNRKLLQNLCSSFDPDSKEPDIVEARIAVGSTT